MEEISLSFMTMTLKKDLMLLDSPTICALAVCWLSCFAALFLQNFPL